MGDMKDLKRIISREESQNHENEDMELDSKQTDSGDTNAKLLNSRVPTEETSVNMELLNAKQHKRKRSSCYYLKNYLIMPVLILAVVFLLYREVVRLTTDSPIRLGNQQPTFAPPRVAAVQQEKSNGFNVQPEPEEFTVDIRSLQESKIIRWNPEAGNKGVLAMPSTNNDCIKFKIDGRFMVHNSITISYTNVKSIFHGIKLEREKKEGMSKGEASRLLRKANYQWSTPQSGRQPSTLQFLVDIQAGDELCVQKSLKSTIYAGSTDNNFLIEKIS